MFDDTLLCSSYAEEFERNVAKLEGTCANPSKKVVLQRFEENSTEREKSVSKKQEDKDEKKEIPQGIENTTER